jgi:D-glycero-beta-D-manno-heptose 1-phosphate adenylyltransferase
MATPSRDVPPPVPASPVTGCGERQSVHAGTAARLRAELPAPIVFTNGVFDLLHAGHVACLEAARQLGASLVVGINGDASARRLRKGPGRPLNRAADRARVVGALSAVSAVVVFDEDKPLALLCALRPEFYVKGGDYRIEDLCEAMLMNEWGGRTVIVPRVPGQSTSALVAALCPRAAVVRPPAAPGMQVWA